MPYTPPPKPQNGKSFTAMDLQAPSPSPQTLKDAQIAKSVALNCAAQITEAYAHIIAATDMVKTMTEPQIKGWLKSLKQTEYAENLKVLTGDEPEIPF